MNDGRRSFALREWRRRLARPQTLAILIAVVAIVTLVGPFGTDDRMAPVPRALYWLCVAASTYAAGVLCHRVVRDRLEHRIDRSALIAVSALTTGGVVTAIVLVFNGLFMGLWPVNGEIFSLVRTIFLVATLIAVVIHIAAAQRKDTPQAPDTLATPCAPPALLDRLSYDKRGPLLAISVEDHYVRVRTAKGCEMILLRLSDAMKEVGATPGLQVHRSHWVALSAVSVARRAADRAILTLIDGTDIPVSRRHVPDIRKAGLLPA